MESKISTYKHGKGYVMQKSRGHARANRDGYVLQHILIAEAALGRPIVLPVQVHHLNGKKDDNTNTNLVICSDASYHRLLDIRTRAYFATGNPTAKHCKYCHGYDNQSDFVVYKDTIAHRSCKNSPSLRLSRRKKNIGF